MTTDLAFHYPPDVFDAVVDAVPLLTRGKHDVVMFFRGSGVDRAFLAGIERRIETESKYSKYHITREILAYLNERGDAGLGPRREVLKRVSEFDDFSSCYPDNQMKARGAVATVAQLVNKKDSFTRMRDGRDRELQRHRDARQAEAAKRDAERTRREQIKNDLFALFGEQNPQRRGKALEGVLNRLFESEGILLREAFERQDADADAGTVEQIDGVVELGSQVYLVEMKWWSQTLGRGEVSSHLVRVYGRGQVGGILISNSGYSPAAIADCRDALRTKTVVLVELREIVQALTLERSVGALLTKKVRAAALEKEPLVYPLDDETETW
jgi:restriction endonuclease Mrr